MSNYIMPTYGRLPVAFSYGEGSWLFDTDGKKYFDALTGIAVCGLGHAHPAVTQAITQQAQKLVHTSNLYAIPQQEKLAQTLCERTQMDNVFFANSGAEANECALKIARKYGNDKGINNPTVITMTGSFHGRTMATLSATGNPKVKTGFSPLVSGFVEVAFNDVDAVQKYADNPDIVAVMVEPAQGEGGINVPDANYLNALREICDANEWLLILDEIQTGNGRTGELFAHHYNGIIPDVLTTAKGLGNGVPIGVCIAKGKASTVLKAGNHGSTYGGNPLVCAAANAVLAELDDAFLAQVKQTSANIKQRLQAGLPQTTDIRVFGLLIGISLAKECTALVQLALDKGLLINVTQGNIVRLLPPLNMSEAEVDFLITEIIALITDFLAS